MIGFNFKKGAIALSALLASPIAGVGLAEASCYTHGNCQVMCGTSCHYHADCCHHTDYMDSLKHELHSQYYMTGHQLADFLDRVPNDLHFPCNEKPLLDLRDAVRNYMTYTFPGSYSEWTARDLLLMKVPANLSLVAGGLARTQMGTLTPHDAARVLAKVDYLVQLSMGTVQNISCNYLQTNLAVPSYRGVEKSRIFAALEGQLSVLGVRALAAQHCQTTVCPAPVQQQTMPVQQQTTPVQQQTTPVQQQTTPAQQQVPSGQYWSQPTPVQQ